MATVAFDELADDVQNCVLHARVEGIVVGSRPTNGPSALTPRTAVGVNQLNSVGLSSAIGQLALESRQGRAKLQLGDEDESFSVKDSVHEFDDVFAQRILARGRQQTRIITRRRIQKSAGINCGPVCHDREHQAVVPAAAQEFGHASGRSMECFPIVHVASFDSVERLRCTEGGHKSRLAHIRADQPFVKDAHGLRNVVVFGRCQFVDLDVSDLDGPTGPRVVDQKHRFTNVRPE